MRYPKKNPYLVFRRIDGGYVAENWISQETYSMDSQTAFFLANLDGKKNPAEIVPGIKPAAVQQVLDEFQDQELLCPEKKPHRFSGGSFLIPFVYLFPGKSQRVIASFWNSLLLCLTIPALVFCILWWNDNYHILQNATLYQKYIGIIIGSYFGTAIHELSHAAATRAYRGFVGEMGIGIRHYIFPVAYTVIEYGHLKKRLKRIQILGAGLESQIIIAACLFFVSRSIYMGPLASILSSAGFMLIISVIYNILPLDGTDGFGILAQMGCNLEKRTQSVIKQRKKESENGQKRRNGKLGFLALAGSYAYRFAAWPTVTLAVFYLLVMLFR